MSALKYFCFYKSTCKIVFLKNNICYSERHIEFNSTLLQCNKSNNINLFIIQEGLIKIGVTLYILATNLTLIQCLTYLVIIWLIPNNLSTLYKMVAYHETLFIQSFTWQLPIMYYQCLILYHTTISSEFPRLIVNEYVLKSLICFSAEQDIAYFLFEIPHGVINA